MNGTVEIRVKEYGGTYIATCKSAKVRASCTAGAQEAAHACAYKIFGKTGFTLTRRADGAAIWTAEALKAAEPAAPVKAWRSSEDLPDDETTVLVRRASDEYPLALAFYGENAWVDCTCQALTYIEDVTGWMHLEDAARILDAATAVEIAPF